MSSPSTNQNPIARFHQWASKKEAYSLLNDFFFVFGVLLFDWNPVLIILWFMVDQAFMGGFVIILFHKEPKSKLYELPVTIIIVGLFISAMAMFYWQVVEFLDEIKVMHLVNPDPSQILNPVILPFLGTFSILNHHREYQEDLKKIASGKYERQFIRHFFSRYLALVPLITIMIVAFAIFQNFYIGILIALISIKAFLRLYREKWRRFL